MADFCYWVTVDKVEVEPPKAQAYLVIIDEKKIWIPASTVHDTESDDNTGEVVSLYIELWMIKKKELESYIEG